MKHAGQVVTRTMLLENVWDYHFDPQTNVIDVHVSRLRSKIDKNFGDAACCTRSAAPATPSVTALTKLFRTTTFRLSLTYLALFGAAAVRCHLLYLLEHHRPADAAAATRPSTPS